MIIDSVFFGRLFLWLIFLTGVGFILAKLYGAITWSWCVVLLPFWGPVAFVLFIMGILFVTFKGRKYDA